MNNNALLKAHNLQLFEIQKQYALKHQFYLLEAQTNWSPQLCLKFTKYSNKYSYWDLASTQPNLAHVRSPNWQMESADCVFPPQSLTLAHFLSVQFTAHIYRFAPPPPNPPLIIQFHAFYSYTVHADWLLGRLASRTQSPRHTRSANLFQFAASTPRHTLRTFHQITPPRFDRCPWRSQRP